MIKEKYCNSGAEPLMARAVLLVLCGGMFVVASGCKSSSPSAPPPVAQAPASPLKPKVELPHMVCNRLTADGMWLIDYAVDGDRLSYAVINGPSQNVVRGHSGMETDSNGAMTAFVIQPDGSRISVWDSGRIFFFSGDDFTECKQPVSGKTFQAFMDSHPTDYTMTNLLSFASSQK